MRGYSIMSDEERQSILQQHNSFYNGYAVGNIPSNLTPLTVYDPAGDKQGINVNNRGEVNTYKNHLVNESTISEQEGKGCAESEGGSGCIKKRGNEWIILNNKKGGVWRDGFKSEEDAKDALDAFHANESVVKEIEADDMDVSSVEPADNFKSGGPEQFEKGDKDGYQMDIQGIMDMFGGEMSPADWDVVFGDELDGKEMYRGEKKAYDFDSEGGNVDVYGESVIREQDEPLYDLADRIMRSRKFDMLANELEPLSYSDEFEFADNFISYLLDDYMDEEYYDDLYDLIKDEYGEIILSMYGAGGFDDEDMFMEENESMCEQCGLSESMCECGMYEEIDEELHESFRNEKQKITEMFNRFKKYN